MPDFINESSKARDCELVRYKMAKSLKFLLSNFISFSNAFTTASASSSSSFVSINPSLCPGPSLDFNSFGALLSLFLTTDIAASKILPV